MLKALFKKQLLELQSVYSPGSKAGKQESGKQNSASNVLLMLFLPAIVFICGAAAFIEAGEAIGSVLLPMGIDWLYFAAMGTLGILLTTASTAVSCYAQLFRAKDNEFLLSLPIPPRLILLVRIAVVLLVALAFAAMAWLPALYEYGVIVGRLGFSSGSAWVAFGLALWPFIAFASAALACIVSWIIAAVSNRIRHKSIAATVVIVALLVGYLVGYTMFAASYQDSLDQGSFTVPLGLASMMKTPLWPLFQMGFAATGDVKAFLRFAVFAVVFFAAVYVCLAASFRRIATGRAKAGGRASFDSGKMRSHSVRGALLKREASRFVSSSAYMVNCGLGIVFMTVLTVALLFNASVVSAVILSLSAYSPSLAQCIPVVLAGVVVIFAGMGVITASSISLEGGNLWIVRSMPVCAHDLMNVKVRFQLLVNGIPSLVCWLVSCVVLGFELPVVVLGAVAICLFVWLHAEFGLALNLRMPKLSWPHETVPIKQSMPPFLALVSSWALAALMIALCFVLSDWVNPLLTLLLFAIVFAVLGFVAHRWVHTAGVKRFEEL